MLCFLTLILRKHREAMKHNIAGIEAIKKQIGKEMELNKKLDSFKQRLADETSSLRRECKYFIVYVCIYVCIFLVI